MSLKSSQAPLLFGNPIKEHAAKDLASRSFSSFQPLVASLAASQGVTQTLNQAEIAELDSLGKEKDPELFFEGLYRLGAQLEGQKAEAAFLLFDAVANNTTLEPVRRRAQMRLEAIQGKGAVGARAEVLLRNFLREATSPNVILPMMAGSAVYELTRTAAFCRLLNSGPGSWWGRGLSARWIAGTAGYVAEVPTFAFSHRAMQSMTSSHPELPSAMQDLSSAAITLGALKLFGSVSAALRRNALRPEIVPGQTLTAGLSSSRAEASLSFFMDQGAVLGGLLVAHRLEEKIGLRQHVEGSTFFMDTLASMVSMGVGARLGQRWLGTGFIQFKADLENKSNAALNSPKLGAGRKSFFLPSLEPIPASSVERHRVFNSVMWMKKDAEAGGGKDRKPKKYQDILKKAEALKNEVWTKTGEDAEEASILIEKLDKMLPSLNPADRLEIDLSLLKYLGKYYDESYGEMTESLAPILGRELHDLPPAQQKALLPKISLMLKSEDISLCCSALEILEFASEKGDARSAEQLAYKALDSLKNDDEEAPSVVSLGIRNIVKHLTPESRTKYALNLLGKMKIDAYALTGSIPAVFEEIVPILSPKDYSKLVAEWKRLHDSLSEDGQFAAVEVAEVFAKRFATKDILPIVLKLQNRLGDDDFGMQTEIKGIHERVVNKSNFEERVKISLGLMERLNSLGEIPEYGENQFYDILRILKGLPIRVRLHAVDSTMQHFGPENIPLEAVGAFVDSMPPSALRKFAESRDVSNLLSLSRFAESGIPWEFKSLWQEFHRSQNKDGFLDSLDKSTEPFRRGKDPDINSEEQMRLAYLALDRSRMEPAKEVDPLELREMRVNLGLFGAFLTQRHFEKPILSWPLFSSEMHKSKDTAVPPPFLKGEFRFLLERQVLIHEKIDKGLLDREAISSLEMADISKVRERFLKLLTHPPRSLRAEVRNYLIRRHHFPQDMDFTGKETLEKLAKKFKSKDAVLAGIRELLSGLAKGNPVPAEVESWVAALAWHRSDAGEIQKNVETYLKQRKEKTEISSNTLIQTLDSLLLFYQDPLQATLTEIGMDPAPYFKKQMDSLRKQKENITHETGRSANVEILFIKARADQFFGYVGEDCNTRRGDEIFKPHFQTARILVDGKLEGMLYLHQQATEGKKVLTMAIAPRERLNLPHDRLLLEIEKGVSKIARESGMDMVLIPAASQEQGNRVDMMSAIKNRRYPTITFENKDSGIFHTKEYFVLWPEMKPMK